MVLDLTGESLLRDGTEEFLGLVIFKDVTEYTTHIAAQIEAVIFLDWSQYGAPGWTEASPGVDLR